MVRKSKYARRSRGHQKRRMSDLEPLDRDVPIEKPDRCAHGITGWVHTRITHSAEDFGSIIVWIEKSSSAS